MNAADFAKELDFSIHHAIEAHSIHVKTPRDAIRFWDQTTPYAIHPIWCAITLLTETRLPDDIRINGYQALLWHDTLEDTNLPLPEASREEVVRLVHEMTFANFADEESKIQDCRDVVKLLKLYDKTSILLDAIWMKAEKWNRLVDYTLGLRQFVLQTYGELNIVRIAGAICRRRPVGP
jgi:hypothetical protein